MLNGQPDVDVAVMRPTIQYTDGLNKTTQVVEWFWEIMTEATRDERAAVLKFCTGEVEGVWLWKRVFILTQHCYPPQAQAECRWMALSLSLHSQGCLTPRSTRCHAATPASTNWYDR